jgi:hypothetical protein
MTSLYGQNRKMSWPNLLCMSQNTTFPPRKKRSSTAQSIKCESVYIQFPSRRVQTAVAMLIGPPSPYPP